jgi:hypothetical protein
VTNITATSALRALLLAAAAVGLALGMTLMSPAAAFVNEDADDGASEEPADDHADDQADDHAGDDDAPGTGDADEGGFVNGDEEDAPVGGVDAGFGGGADQGGLGAPHAAAIALLGLALAGHAANARRTASDRA